MNIYDSSFIMYFVSTCSCIIVFALRAPQSELKYSQMDLELGLKKGKRFAEWIKILNTFGAVDGIKLRWFEEKVYSNSTHFDAILLYFLDFLPFLM